MMYPGTMDAAKKKTPAGPPTPEQIRELLDRSDYAVEEAVLRLFERQTRDEQAARDTRHRNSRGFSAAHARLGSKYAGWIRGMRAKGSRPGTCLQRADHKVKARDLVRHYVRQLHEKATAKWEALAGAQSRIEADHPLPSLDDLQAVNAHALAMHGHKPDPLYEGTMCVCGGLWLGEDCETRTALAADLEDSRRAAAAKARLEADEIMPSRLLPTGMTARLRAPTLAFTSLPAHPDQGVDLPAGATCMVLRTTLNRSQGPLYMTQGLFGARALWVPAHCLEPKK